MNYGFVGHWHSANAEEQPRSQSPSYYSRHRVSASLETAATSSIWNCPAGAARWLRSTAPAFPRPALIDATANDKALRTQFSIGF
jgi:hypothetical protein